MEYWSNPPQPQPTTHHVDLDEREFQAAVVQFLIETAPPDVAAALLAQSPGSLAMSFDEYDSVLRIRWTAKP